MCGRKSDFSVWIVCGQYRELEALIRLLTLTQSLSLAPSGYEEEI
jgi:hypothetical protein